MALQRTSTRVVGDDRAETASIQWIGPEQELADRDWLETALPEIETILESSADDREVVRGMPTHLRSMCELPLLSAAEERLLFRALNQCRYLAAQCGTEGRSARADGGLAADAPEYLALAERIRDRLVRANMRLAISVIKKFVSPQQSFDDCLSDSLVVLMNAVDKFDYSLGFRFSTYAYRSIARNAYRVTKTMGKERAQFAAEFDLDTVSQAESPRAFTSAVWSRLRSLAEKLIGQLDAREQLIVRSRFALGDDNQVRTFQSLADELGISKERARQLAHRAVEKLRVAAGQQDLEVA